MLPREQLEMTWVYMLLVSHTHARIITLPSDGRFRKILKHWTEHTDIYCCISTSSGVCPHTLTSTLPRTCSFKFSTVHRHNHKHFHTHIYRFIYIYISYTHLRVFHFYDAWKSFSLYVIDLSPLVIILASLFLFSCTFSYLFSCTIHATFDINSLLFSGVLARARVIFCR